MMDQITDKLILLGFGGLLLFDCESLASPVVALLTAIAAAALGIYIEEKKFFYLLLAAVFVMAVFEPMTLLFFPVLLYDMAYKKSYIPAIPFLLLFMQHLPQTPVSILAWVFMAVLAVILAYKTGNKQFLAEELIRIRDSSTELNLILREKNKNLLEKQDYEIYLATLRERNRIAREIHDNVGHMLSRSLLMTGALLTVEKEGAVHGQLLNLKETLDLAMNSIRESVHNLHERSVDLEQTVYEIADSIRQDYDVRLDYDMSEDIPRRVKYCMIAATKEAVSNFIKHSNGSKIQMRFREHPGFYQLTIEDNGKNIEAAAGRGIGLQNMRERVDTLGGTIHIHTKAGFCIFLSIPKTEEILCE